MNAKNSELSAQDVEETLQAICKHPIGTLAAPLKQAESAIVAAA